MDRRSIARFKKLLEMRRAELRAGLTKDEKDETGANHDYGKDEGDRANTSIAKEIDAAQASRNRNLLNAVESALNRIKSGTFGDCLNCGQEINAKRLEAIPSVRYCITCQELIDSSK
jgi:DnaK suppressor protein